MTYLAEQSNRKVSVAHGAAVQAVAYRSLGVMLRHPLAEHFVLQPVRRILAEVRKVLERGVRDHRYQSVSPRHAPSIVKERGSETHRAADFPRVFRREEQGKYGAERKPSDIQRKLRGPCLGDSPHETAAGELFELAPRSACEYA